MGNKLLVILLKWGEEIQGVSGSACCVSSDEEGVLDASGGESH